MCSENPFVSAHHFFKTSVTGVHDRAFFLLERFIMNKNGKDKTMRSRGFLAAKPDNPVKKI